MLIIAVVCARSVRNSVGLVLVLCVTVHGVPSFLLCGVGWVSSYHVCRKQVLGILGLLADGFAVVPRGIPPYVHLCADFEG